MARRRAKRSGLDSEFAKPLAGLALLGLLWGAYELGLVNAAAEWMVDFLR